VVVVVHSEAALLEAEAVLAEEETMHLPILNSNFLLT
jgi:hypothetical protein